MCPAWARRLFTIAGCIGGCARCIPSPIAALLPGGQHALHRDTLLNAARERIEAEFDERIVVEAALGLVRD